MHYIQHGFAEGRTDKPNFVVILADDLGWGEVGARHVGDVATPNIDAIARAGVTFTDGYVPANLCMPSRAGLLTGRYPQEFGVYRNPRALSGQLRPAGRRGDAWPRRCGRGATPPAWSASGISA